MDSDYMNLIPTPAQQLVDTRFLEEMEDSFVRPLVAELEELVPGYAEMNPTARWVAVLKLNEPLFGKGDHLDFYGMYVYAGTQIGHMVTKRWEDVTVSQYHPRFANMESGHLLSINGGEETISDIEYFFRYERNLYDGLPISYRAALIYTYIREKVIADAEETARFVLGCYLDSLERFATGRIGVRPIFGNSNLYRGWNVQIRDAKPSEKLMRELGRYIRYEASCNENLAGDHMGGLVKDPLEEADISGTGSIATPVDYTSVLFEDADLERHRKRRAPKQKTELACRFVYELEQSGVIDGRKGGIGYAGALAKLQLQYEDMTFNYTPDSLGRVYRGWKERNGLS